MPAAANAGDQGSCRDPKLKRLLIRPGAIGDTIVSLPALEHCKAAFTEAWVSAPCVPLIQFADRVCAISSTGLDLLEFGLDRRARTALVGFDSIISWYGASRPEFREAVADLPFEFHPALPQEPGIHAVDYYMRQVGGSDGAVPTISVEPQQKRDFLAVHPFSGSPRKNWPLENFQQIAGHLPLPVEFSAGPEESLAGAVRFDNLKDLARWLAGARGYVGNDSGISHLAAALGVPAVVIFRCTDPAIWAPRGRAPLRILHGDPPVEEVYRAVLDLLT